MCWLLSLMPRKIRKKKVFEVKDRREEFQDWFLRQSSCRLERRKPSQRSGDPEERKWANWINTVRCASSITAANISVQVDWILLSCGCVRKGVKRVFSEEPSCPGLGEDLTRQSAIRRRQTVVVDDGLLTTTAHGLSGHQLILNPDMIGTFDLSTRYEDLPLQYRKLYDFIRPSVLAPSTCQGVNAYSGRSCKRPPAPGSNFCVRCDGVDNWGGTGITKWSDDQHRDIMFALSHHLKRLWDAMSSRGRRSPTQD